MNSSDKYNKLVYEIGQLKSGANVNPQDFDLDYGEFKSIIDEVERDNLFNNGHWLLNGGYIFMGLTFRGRSFIESNDGKQYSKIERVEVSNHTHINIGHDNTGNIIVGSNNHVKSAYDIKFQELIDIIYKSTLHDKNTVIETLEKHKNDKEATKNILVSLLSRGAEIASITSAIGTLIGLL